MDTLKRTSGDYITRSLRDAMQNWQSLRASWQQVLAGAERSGKAERADRAREGIAQADEQLKALRARLVQNSPGFAQTRR